MDKQYAVVWIQTDKEWRPWQELPDEFRVVSTLAEPVDYMVARVIEAGANARMLNAGPCGRWAFTLEQSGH